MKYDIRVSSQANEDLNGIFEYIALALYEKETAVSIIKLLQESIMTLDEMPGRYRLCEKEPWKTRGVHIMPVKNYLIFYVFDSGTKKVDILRIFYGARNLDMLC